MYKDLMKFTIEGADKMDEKELREALIPECDLFEDLAPCEVRDEIEAGYLVINGNEVTLRAEIF